MGKESERREGLAKLRLREGPEHRASSPDAAALTTEGEAGWLQKQWVRGLTAIYTDGLSDLLEPQFSYLLNGDGSSTFPVGLWHVKACVPSS